MFACLRRRVKDVMLAGNPYSALKDNSARSQGQPPGGPVFSIPS
jgi:hypothetical protein